VGDMVIGVQSTFIVPNHISFLLQKVYTLCLAKFCCYIYGIKLKVMGDWIDRTPPTNDIPQDELPTSSKIGLLFFFIFVVIAFLLRNNKYLGWMWLLVKGFFIAIFFYLIADRVKNNLKDWWNK
jgi:hypothetical protein